MKENEMTLMKKEANKQINSHFFFYLELSTKILRLNIKMRSMIQQM
jgi:hypothetical protein